MYQLLSQVLNKQKRPPLNHIELSVTPVSAAVLVLCSKQDGQDCLIFTKRTELVNHHKGQISFPGGVRDESDKNLWETALREAYEEIGLESRHVTYVGELGCVITPTGFRITPFLGIATHPLSFKPNPTEIAEIFSVPVSHLLNPNNVVFTKKVYFEKEYLDPLFTYKNHQIWGATGRILVDFCDVWKSCC